MKDFEAQADCPVCEGTGGYCYDETHGTTCKLCCPHSVWYLQGVNHPRPGEVTCSACGYQARDEPWQRFSPDFTPEVGAKYRILWSKRVKKTPFMPDPRIPEIVREDQAIFGRNTRAGKVAIVDVVARKMGAKPQSHEIDPETILAVMRVL